MYTSHIVELHPIGAAAAVAQVIHLVHFTLLIPHVWQLHQPVFTPLMSPLLNACFSTTPESCADGHADARS